MRHGDRERLSVGCVVGWLTSAAFLAYLCRNSMGVLESTIRNDLELTVEQVGWMMAAFFWPYALLQVPAGWMAARWGTRVSLALSAVGWSLGAIAVGLSQRFWQLALGQVLMGAAQAGVFPSSMRSYREWVSSDVRARACAMSAVGMQFGAISAAFLTGSLLFWMSWRSIYAVYAIPCLIWSVGFYLFFRDRGESCDTIDSEHDADKASHIPWGRIVSSQGVWCLCLQQVFRASGYIFFASWLPTLMQETRDVSVATSGWMQGMVFAGSTVGSLVGGRLCDKILRETNNRRWSRAGVGAVCTFGSALLVLAAYFVQDATRMIGLVTMAAMLAGAAGPAAYVASIDLGKQHVSTVFGLMNMFGNVGAAMTPILVGRFFALSGNWNLVLCFFAAVYLSASVCWLLLDPHRSIVDA